MNNINNLNVGANSLVKRVASNNATPATGSAARPAGYGTDSLVRNGASNPVAASANATATAAIDRLANCFHEDAHQFARNLAEATLNDVCRLVG